MVRRLLIVACLLLLSAPASWAQTPAPDAMAAARSLVTTMKLADQYKALLPAILLGLKPALTQDRPEIEHDYDAMMPMIADAFTPYYTSMVDGIAPSTPPISPPPNCATSRRSIASRSDKRCWRRCRSSASRRSRSARRSAARPPRTCASVSPRRCVRRDTSCKAGGGSSSRRCLAQALIDHQPARDFELAQGARNERSAADADSATTSI